MNEGYVNLFRKMIDWQWYRNQNTKDLFIHCLLKANWKDGKFENIIIERGSFVTSLDSLSKELNLSKQQIRTAIEHLESSNEIVQKSTNRYTLITVVKYREYQSQNEISTNKQQTNNKQITPIETFNKNNKENNNNIIYNKKEIIKEKYFDDDKLNDVFMEFMDIRKKKNAVNSERAITTLINKLNKYDDDTKTKMLEQSIVNSWKDVYELKPKAEVKQYSKYDKGRSLLDKIIEGEDE